MSFTPAPAPLRFAVPAPRSLRGQRAVTIQMACPCCGSPPWQDCPAGTHLARWHAARERNLITGAELSIAIGAAGSSRSDAVVPA